MSKYESYKVGKSEFSFMGPSLFVISKEYGPADLVSNVYDVPIEAGLFVVGVLYHVETQWAGGSPTVDVGDGSTADAFIDTADVTITNQHAVGNSLGKANASSQGKFYSTAGVVRCTHAASSTSGKSHIMVLCLNTVGNWRTPSTVV